MEIFISIILGISLSASCGFRIFIPPLIVSIFYKLNIIELPIRYEWAKSNIALIVLVIATVVEILAYYIPVIDNFLDTISVPTSIVAGTLMSITFINFDNEVISWVIAAILGGGSAVGVSALTSGIRLVTTSVTVGMGNALFSTLEWISSMILSVISILLPVLSILLLILLVITLNYIRTQRKNNTNLN
jgi:hypothetical protein